MNLFDLEQTNFGKTDPGRFNLGPLAKFTKHRLVAYFFVSRQ